MLTLVVFWVYAFLSGLSTLTILITGPETLGIEPGIWFYASQFVSPVVVVGLFGFTYRKRFLQPVVWQVVWCLNIALSFILTTELWSGMDAQQILIGVLFTTYEVGALYLYAFRTDDWLSGRTLTTSAPD